MSDQEEIIIAEVRESLSGKKIREALAEASLSRIWQIFKESQFGIITSWRSDGTTEKDNDANFDKIQKTIRGAGYGFVILEGFGQEDLEDGTVVQVKEPSLLVKNVKKGEKPVVDSRTFDKFIIELGQQYNQYGMVLHAPSRGTRLVVLKDKDGNRMSPRGVEAFKEFKPNEVSDFFSRLRDGRSFYFEGFKFGNPVDGWFHGMHLNKSGEVNTGHRESTKNWLKKMREF